MQDTGQTALVKSFTIYMHIFFVNGEMSLSPSLIIACQSSLYLNVYKTNSKRSGRENKALQLVGKYFPRRDVLDINDVVGHKLSKLGYLLGYPRFIIQAQQNVITMNSLFL